MPEESRQMPKEIDMLTAMGNADFDAEAYVNSESFNKQSQMPSQIMFKNGASMEEISLYWEAHGLRRELHGDPEDTNSQWISYVPAYTEDLAASNAYPLLFVLHGAFNPIALAETYGYAELAEKEKLILIIPENERADNIMKLLEYAGEHFPVDKSRVYCVGFSFGGMSCARIALQYPDVFAGAGMGGMVHASGSPSLEMTGVTYPAFELTPELVETAKNKIMPACIFVGENEVLNLVPFYKDGLSLEKDPERLVEPFPLAKLAAYNVWRQAGGCGPVDQNELISGPQRSADIGENKIGALFERTEVRNYDKRSYYIGDCVKPDGECHTRFICAAKNPHWVTNRMADLIWEHIGKFARNRQDGTLHRIG
jgi:pimeloyl-ACP methyl ester carboxylesterase